MDVVSALYMCAMMMTRPETLVDLGEITVEIGTPIVVHKSDTERAWFPSVFQLQQKKLIVTIQRAEDDINPNALASLYRATEDGGRTWSEPHVWQEGGNSWVRLEDGTCLWLSYLLTFQSENVAKCRVGRSRDGVTYAWTDGAVDVAPYRFGHMKKGTASFVFHQSILEMPDESLLATLYGSFEDDASYRSIVVRSTDGGSTWNLLSTIAYDPTLQGEGACEPSMVRLANGELFCMMRVNSAKAMVWARSTDNGQTWSSLRRMPEEYASMSVDPDLIVLSNGMLACSAGRPDCWLTLSLDGTGTEWTRPVLIFQGPSTCYTTIREVAPNELLYVHDVTPAGWEKPKEGMFHEIRAVPISVRRNPAVQTSRTEAEG